MAVSWVVSMLFVCGGELAAVAGVAGGNVKYEKSF